MMVKGTSVKKILIKLHDRVMNFPGEHCKGNSLPFWLEWTASPFLPGFRGSFHIDAELGCVGGLMGAMRRKNMSGKWSIHLKNKSSNRKRWDSQTSLRSLPTDEHGGLSKVQMSCRNVFVQPDWIFKPCHQCWLHNVWGPSTKWKCRALVQKVGKKYN